MKVKTWAYIYILLQNSRTNSDTIKNCKQIIILQNPKSLLKSAKSQTKYLNASGNNKREKLQSRVFDLLFLC